MGLLKELKNGFEVGISAANGTLLNKINDALAEASDITVNVDGNDYNIKHSQRVCELNSAKGAVCLPMTDGTCSIVVDDFFLKMSSAAQKFIIAHELGHIHYDLELMFNSNDVLKLVKERQKMLAHGVVHPTEIRADIFAVELIGKDAAIKGIIEMMKIPWISKKELRLRLMNLMIFKQ